MIHSFFIFVIIDLVLHVWLFQVLHYSFLSYAPKSHLFDCSLLKFIGVFSSPESIMTNATMQKLNTLKKQKLSKYLIWCQ